MKNAADDWTESQTVALFLTQTVPYQLQQTPVRRFGSR